MATHLQCLCQRGLLTARILSSSFPGVQQVAGMKVWPDPPSFKHIPMPEDRTKCKLQFLPKTPILPGKAPLYTKRLDLIRGLEDLHTEFLHNQYGIVALNGGYLEWGHVEMIRNTINRKINTKKMFAVWRIDPPWFPKTKKGIGKRMGGGRPGISKYVVPVKTDRIILELGGHVSFTEVYPILKIVAANLPFEAEAISAEKLAEKRAKLNVVQHANTNQYKFKNLIQNNILGCDSWVSKQDRVTFGRCV